MCGVEYSVCMYVSVVCMSVCVCVFDVCMACV